MGSIESFAETIGLGKDLTTQYGTDWAKRAGMKEKWIKEIMEASTRVNVSSSLVSDEYQERGLMLVREKYGSDPWIGSWG